MPTPTPADRVREIAPLLRETAAEGEAARALDYKAEAALIDAGVFRMMLPRSLGGEEVSLLEFGRTVREVARADGSAGWCAMISGVYAAFGGLLPRPGAEQVFADPRAVVAGSLAPLGQAVRVDGGYRVSGRWPFGSNGPHATWWCGGAALVKDGAPVMHPSGMRPEFRLAFFPASSVTIIDSWRSTGLCGTSSHDYAVDDVFVPDDLAFWFADPPVEAGPLYALPAIAAFGTAIAIVPLGIAQHALDEFVSLAATKKPTASQQTLAEKGSIHDRLGVVRADLEAAEAYLERAIAEAWEVVAAGGRVNWQQRGKLWLAATHTGTLALRAVESLYTMAGSTSVYAAGPLDRCLRDCRTAVQHVVTQYANYETAGKQQLGLDPRGGIWSFDDRGDG